ncbi:cation transporter : Heavy metal efflux pump CzcA OS=Blastopirellula marina DSM 3645 GN=DSM3645_00565 PE=4 SV=1: ACR_tran [Gemmataceae bacterium]|nr:cation transporter : Heavy metal efflux pump CzcA OS=Blastopirellula marina DSM 3645 GN=DSM3645_00565 PE=4 SV=1: ACR_tran [Gemmataceae bacterium]VTU01669.1 cation transporter : Heavy metal efflux pump CzcA OS=Blastopirellula marina DSM 3645 GN=DSM3645_00565 PE=4 SV=1: ACR_tran [Gemmataceae bacterium]
MLNRVIDWSLKYRWLVILGAVALAAAGAVSLRFLDIDAFPDTTPVQVQINTVAPSLGPAEIEQQITFPVEQSLAGLPKIAQMRSISKFGLSQVVVIFDEGTDIYFARQLINERLAAVQLPQGLDRPKMGPVSTGLGEVFHYVVTGKGDDVTRLRTIHDWVVRPQMRKVKGVAEVNSWGGFERQYQARIDPSKLAKYGLTFDAVTGAMRENNHNVGGGVIDQGSGTLLVQGLGRTVTVEQIRSIQVAAKDGVPVLLGDVADVRIGHEVRRGAVTADGKGEVVLGLGFMTMGENSHEVTWGLKGRLDEVKATLPGDVKVVPVYDRTELIAYVLATARANLFEGGLLVVCVLFLFLGNLRAAFIVALAIPLSMLFAFSGMLRFGIAASLLSLGAIDFGMVVDSSVVMVENCVRHLAHNTTGRSRREVIRDAAVEVRTPTLFGELIILIVYLPILTLEGIEGKLFRPMALTVVFALAGSMILSMTLMPALASLLLPKRISEREPLLLRLVKAVYVPVLKATMRHKFAVIVFAGTVLFVAFGMVAPRLGSEFVPRLSEGAITLGTVRLAGTSLEESVATNTRIEKALLAAFPDEINHVWSRAGTAEVATDPMGVELTDIFISLKPRARWTKAATQADLTLLVEKELRQMPGLKFAFAQPIEMRINEMLAGTRSDLSVKLFGDDLDVLKAKAEEIRRAMKDIPGAADLAVEQVTGQPVMQVKVRQDQIARYGVPVRAVLDLIESIGSKPIGEVVDGQFRFPLVVRLPDEWRKSPEAVGSIQLPTATGERIPLSRVADIKVVEGPSTITREWGQRRIVVTCNVRGRDLGSFVAEVQQKVKAEVAMPPGRYHVAYGGQFEQLERAQTRLMIVVPVALLLIFLLLYATYGNVVDTVRVFTGVPFAWVGGVFALWLRDMPFSISAGIGFIALSGVAVLDDMILVSYVRQLQRRGRTLEQAVEEAAITRLRPVLMTTLVACLGFVPMAFSTGMGAEVQRPLATVVIGGVISAMVMSLLVLRVLFVVFQTPKQRRLAGGEGRPHQVAPATVPAR